MRKVFNVLLAMLAVAVCAVSSTAAPPLAKMAVNGPGKQTVGTVSARGMAGSTARQMFSTPKFSRSGARLNKEVKTAPPLKGQSYDTGADISGLLGWVNYSEDGYDFHFDSGLYEIPTKSGQEYTKRFLSDMTITGGTVKDGIYYCCYVQRLELYGKPYTFIYYDGYDLATVNPNEYDRARYYYSVDVIATSMTFDDSTETIYAIVTDDQSGEQSLVTFDFREAENDFTYTRIGNLPGEWRTLVCDRAGQLYGIRYYTEPGLEYDVVTRSELYRIDFST